MPVERRHLVGERVAFSEGADGRGSGRVVRDAVGVREDDHPVPEAFVRVEERSRRPGTEHVDVLGGHERAGRIDSPVLPRRGLRHEREIHRPLEQAGRKRHVRQLRGHQVAGIPVRSHRLRNLGQDVGRVEELASVVLRCGGALSSRPRTHGGRRT